MRDSELRRRKKKKCCAVYALCSCASCVCFPTSCCRSAVNPNKRSALLEERETRLPSSSTRESKEEEGKKKSGATQHKVRVTHSHYALFVLCLEAAGCDSGSCSFQIRLTVCAVRLHHVFFLPLTHNLFPLIPHILSSLVTPSSQHGVCVDRPGAGQVTIAGPKSGHD